MAAKDATEENIAEARDIIARTDWRPHRTVSAGRAHAQRGWLQGRFTVRLLDVVVQSAAGVMPSQERDGSEQIVIDFAPPPSAAKVDRVKELYDQGLMNKEIASELHCSPSTVTKLIDFWFEWRGQVKPDPRARAATLRKGQKGPPLYERISENVKSLWDQGVSVLKMAKDLKCSTMAITHALSHWHRTRGLPVPTGRSRLRTRAARARQLYDEGWPLKDIAEELGYSHNGLRMVLKESFAANGQSMPDGRLRRHQDCERAPDTEVVGLTARQEDEPLSADMDVTRSDAKPSRPDAVAQRPVLEDSR